MGGIVAGNYHHIAARLGNQGQIAGVLGRKFKDGCRTPAGQVPGGGIGGFDHRGVIEMVAQGGIGFFPGSHKDVVVGGE